MKLLFRLSGVVSLVVGLSALAQPAQAAQPAAAADRSKPAAASEVAVMQTTEGTMVIEFWPDVAPKTVENFKKLARDGFYDGTAFHRIIKGFMIQGGDPNTKDPAKASLYGQGGPGYKIKAEFNKRPHVKGVLSMARSPDPNSAGSQFFICHGTASGLDGQYTAFGKLIKGEDVLDKIANTPVTRGSEPTPSKPTKRVGVVKVEIVAADSLPE
jgi:peptidyl-prolyl cis-trans isomerase B (cyclophilin B)